MSVISLSAPFYLAAAMAAVNAALAYLRLPESLPPERRSRPHERGRMADAFRHGRGLALGAVVLTYFFGTVGFAMMTTLFALFTEHRYGYDAVHTGYLFAFVGIVGDAADRYGRTPFWAGGALLLVAFGLTLGCAGLTEPRETGAGPLDR